MYVRARVEMRNGGRVLSAVVLVDTGATGVVVDEGMVEQLGLELFGEGKIVTLGSVVKCCFSDVGSMAVEDVDIGSRRVAMCRFPEVKGRFRPLGFSEGVMLGVSAVEDAGYVPDTREGVLRRAGFLAL